MQKDIFKIIEKNFGFWLIIMTFVGFLFPQWFTWGEGLTDKLLMFSFFLGCLRIDFQEAVHLKANYGKLIFFAFLNLILLPVLLYVATPFLGLDTRTGMFLVMAAPGGMLTPLIASFLGLNVLWAVVYVLLTSSLVPFVLPLLVEWLFGVKMDVSGFEMILFLSKIVFPPAILAFLIRTYTPKFALKFMRYSGTIGSLNMALFFAIIISRNHEFLTDNAFTWSTIPLILLISALFVFRYVIGFFMPFRHAREQWSNALLFGVMNNGIIILFASQYFSEQVLFIAILSEIPWSIAQPVFQRIHQTFFKP